MLLLRADTGLSPSASAIALCCIASYKTRLVADIKVVQVGKLIYVEIL